MAFLQLMKLCPTPTDSPVKFACFCSRISSTSIVGLHISGIPPGRRRLRLYCKAEDGGNQSNREEPPESLFMKELRKRGITPTSLLEEKDDSTLSRSEETMFREEDGGWNYSRKNGSTIDAESSVSNQLEMSRALNSEGLEGLIPRAKLLLRLGATFFLAFWPLIIATVASFSALYLYLGSEFVHDGSSTPVSLPTYVDPYRLLEDEKIYPTASPNWIH